MNDNTQERGRLQNVIGLLKYIKEFRLLMAISILCELIYKALPIISSFLLSYMISEFMQADLSVSVMVYFMVLCLLVILRAVGRYASTILSHDLAYRILAVIRIKLYEKIEQISPAFMQGKRSGNIISVIMSDVSLLEWFYAHTFGEAIITVILTIAIVITLSVLHPLLGLCVIPWIAALIAVNLLMKKKADQQGGEVRKRLGNFSSELVDGVQGIKDIISLNWQPGYRQRLSRAEDSYNEAKYIEGNRRGIESAIMKIIMAMAVVTSLLLCAVMVQNGSLDAKWYLVAVTLTSSVISSASSMVTISTQFGNIFASASRVISILETEPIVHDDGTLSISSAQSHRLKFDKVSFTYPGNNEPTLKEVSFTINPGETVALAGSSGAGKSTIASLLQRFYEPDSGNIQIGEHLMQEYKLEALRACVSVVPQDVYLFNASIKENLRMAKPDATDAQIIRAAEMSTADEFINLLPQGYDTIVGENGGRFSGGQKQRIAIARAFLKDSGILLLDEASSNLDSENEELVNTALQKLKQNKTTLIVAHRLSTLKTADRIVFLACGQVVDIGTFDELIARCALFKEVTGLYKKMAG